MFRAISGFARNSFARYPFVANSVVYGSLYVAAETSQQTLQKKFLTKPPQDLDVKQIGRYGVISTCALSPILYNWYKWLDGKLPGTAKKIVFKKLMMDQFGMTPILLFVFFTGMSILEGQKDILAEFKSKMATTYATSCAFWLPMTTVNFLFVPPAMRVVFIGCCTCVWSNILCYIKNLK